MTFGSVCSGIEAATVAWLPLGWRCAWLAEVDPFCCALLKHYYAEVRNYGDFTTIRDAEPVDVLVGGTPCQSFSVAGRRAGLDDPRGNLTLEFLALAGRLRPRWVVWENVPGVLSDDGGRTFGTVLGILGQLGYGFAYRILDAQHFGVPQRRRRVFVVGHLGDWRRAAAVLFERHCMSGNPPPSREAGKDVAGSLANRARGGGGIGTDFDLAGGTQVSMSLNANGGSGQMDGESEMFALRGISDYGDGRPLLRAKSGDYGGGSEALVAHSLRADGFDASEDGTGRGTPIVPCGFIHPRQCRGSESSNQLGIKPDAMVSDALTQEGPGARTGASTDDPRAGIGIGEPGDPMFTLQSGKQHAIAFDQYNQTISDVAQALTVGSGTTQHNAVAFSCKDHAADVGTLAPTLRAMTHDRSHANAGDQVAVAFQEAQTGCREYDTAGTLRADGPGHDPVGTRVRSGMSVRRLTPRECDRLQGFKDDYTLIPYRGKPAADGPRYRALGNSMAVPVMRWIGERIAAVEEIMAALERAA